MAIINILDCGAVADGHLAALVRTGGDEHHRSGLRRFRAGPARKMHRLDTGAPARRQTGEGERRTGEIENCAHAAACAQFFK